MEKRNKKFFFWHNFFLSFFRNTISCGKKNAQIITAKKKESNNKNTPKSLLVGNFISAKNLF